MPGPYLVDFYPLKAEYRPGEPVTVRIEAVNPMVSSCRVSLRIAITRLLEQIATKTAEVDLPPGPTIIDLALEEREDLFAGYGLELSLASQDGEHQILTNAFDVASERRRVFRYGFLSDFDPSGRGNHEDLDCLLKLHLNTVQFYDWMYRHDDYLPPTSIFTDPMGRVVSHEVVGEKIDVCHRLGMKALAYGAVYAASKEFYENHKEWALYDDAGRAHNLAGLFYIMNISAKSPWRAHILGEYIKAVTKLGFDGIHLDTYGFPKRAYSRLGGVRRLENLQEHFPVMIEAARQHLAGIIANPCLIFNAVGNWPVETVAPAAQDAVYIEVWRPYERYHHLQELIREAKRLGRGKPVVLAAYLGAFAGSDPEAREKANTAGLLLTAVIAACGGGHLFLGGDKGVLTQGYYVDHARYDEGFYRRIRRYYDFIVRFGEVLFDPELVDVSMTHTAGDNLEYGFDVSTSPYGEPDKIWTIIRERTGRKTINLISLSGVKSDLWNEGKERPAPIEEICVSVEIQGKTKVVYYASPDINLGRPVRLTYHREAGRRGQMLVFKVPQLCIWDLVVVEIEE